MVWFPTASRFRKIIPTTWGVLLLAIALGTGLRFWQLAAKPLWLDEILTALFSLGQSYQVVPLEQTIGFSDLLTLFHLQPTTCTAIAATVTQESTHPPLFFCAMHQWLTWLAPAPDLASLTWHLRSFPALMGVLLIALLYWLNRVAFDPRAGAWGALLMAVSPFAIYLSQEARHYTLPMVWLTLALICLIQMQRDLYQVQRFRPHYWLGWVVVNSLGLYTHYFFLMAVVAQVGVLLGRSLWERRWLTRWQWGAVGFAIAGVGLAYWPWLATLQGHADRGETSWLQLANPFAPIYQTVLTWVAMVMALPVENQPWWLIGPMGVLTLGCLVWLGRVAGRGGVRLWQMPHTHLETWTLLGFILLVLLQFWMIAYDLNRDITIAPRYSFVYYPAVCALLAAACRHSVAHNPESLDLPARSSIRALISALISALSFSQRRFPIAVFTLSLLSSLFVIGGLAFTKPFQPQQVARHLGSEPEQALMIAIGYKNFQDVALGLSFALALPPFYPQTDMAAVAFLKRVLNYEGAWTTLATLPHPPTPLTLWAISPELRRRDYPAQLTLASGVVCAIDPQQHYRIGIPYQRYQCLNFQEGDK